MDDQRNAETGEEARQPRQIFDIATQENSIVCLFKLCFRETCLALNLLQRRLEPYLYLPDSWDRGKCALHRFERIEVDWRGKGVAGHFDLLDTIQAKQTLPLAQMAVANRVPDSLMRDDSIRIEHTFRILSMGRTILQSHTPPSLEGRTEDGNCEN